MVRATRISLLVFVTPGMCALANGSETRNDDFLVVTETYEARDGVLEMRLNTAAIRQVGLTLLGDAAFVGDLLFDEGAYGVLSVNDQTRAATGGDLALRWPRFGLAVGTGPAEVFASPRFVHDIAGESGFEYSILDETSPVFRLTAMRMELRRDYQALVMEADLRVARELGERLGSEAATGRVIGQVVITMRTVLTDRVVTDVRASTPWEFTAERRLFAGASHRTPGPDVIVGDLPQTGQFGRVGSLGSGTVGLSVGTTSCNKGDTPFNWFALPNADHPMIPMNMYRLKIVDGAERFEQIGQSWMKHGFTALQFDACDLGCTPNPNGTRLGVGCSDPYSVGLNASQCGLGPRSALNPYTGEIPTGPNMGFGGNCFGNYPAQDHRGHEHDEISHRLQVLDVDLLPSLNAGATYFAEGQYITPHEFAVANGNQLNNVSHRPVGVSAPDDNGEFTFTNLGPTVREQPAITAWTGATLQTVTPEPFVDGLAIVGYRATGLGTGQTRYEYAVYNMNLDRSIRLFRVPVPSGVNVTNIGFHAPLNHVAESGADTYSNDAWTVSTTTGAVEWSTGTLAEDPGANAIRFGTLYNFRFDADSSARDTEATVGFFKTGDPEFVAIRGPSAGSFDCNQNGINDACDFSCSNVGCDVPGCGGSFDCNNNTIPDECDLAAGRASDCNSDGIPDDCTGCADDCECDDGVTCTSGTCVSGACVQETLCDVGMICDAQSEVCRDCIDAEECEDGDPCTIDTCTDGRCGRTPATCQPGLVCDSNDGECKECVNDGDCSVGLVCGTATGTCEECFAADDCDDGDFCNGSESCVNNQCQPGGTPCPGRRCRSSDNQCVDCLSASDCGNSDPCDGISTCSESGICVLADLESDCNGNGFEDECDLETGVGRDCQPNGTLDACDIMSGTSMDKDGDGVPDECQPCGSNSDCLDSLVCTFDLCVDGTCRHQDSLHGDVAGVGGTCGPDGVVSLPDILAVLDAFQGIFAPPCTLPNIDIACGSGASCCTADGNIDLLDILAVLNAFQGTDGCCINGR